MSWRDDPYIAALVRGALLIFSAEFLVAGVVMLTYYLLGYQPISIWIAVPCLIIGVMCLIVHMALMNGWLKPRKKRA